MPRPARAALLGQPLLLVALLAAGSLRAQSTGALRQGWYGARTGLLHLQLVDEAVSPLRYTGSDLPLQLQLGGDGARAAWDLAFELRHATLSHGATGAGSGDDRQVALRGAWSRRAAGSPSSPVMLRLGLSAGGWARVRSQQYPIDKRQYAHVLFDLAPGLALERARARDAFSASAQVPVLALALQAYGADVWRPWTVRPLGRELRGARLALDWSHRMSRSWCFQLGYREELLRLGAAPALAETVRGVVTGLAYRPGRLP